MEQRQPGTVSGLQGVVFSPFIHSNIEHLYNNSIPLMVLLAALFFFYSKEAWGILVFGILLSGGLTWIIGRENYHIGASGLIYVLVSFIFFKGIQTQYYRLVALSLTVVVLYGGMVWYVFPKIDDTISWEGHLSGLISGLVLTFFYKKPEFKKVINTIGNARITILPKINLCSGLMRMEILSIFQNLKLRKKSKLKSILFLYPILMLYMIMLKRRSL